MESPGALRRMTRYRNAVSSEVFSSRLVVASINAKTFANAAYGTLAEMSANVLQSYLKHLRFSVFPTPFQVHLVQPRQS